MKTVEEAATLLRQIAEPRPVGDTVKTAITRAARRVSPFLDQALSYSRAEDIWRREARRIRVDEMDAIRAAHQARARDFRAQSQAVAALADVLDRVVAGVDAGESRVDSDQLRQSARAARLSARALGRLADDGPEA